MSKNPVNSVEKQSEKANSKGAPGREEDRKQEDSNLFSNLQINLRHTRCGGTESDKRVRSMWQTKNNATTASGSKIYKIGSHPDSLDAQSRDTINSPQRRECQWPSIGIDWNGRQPLNLILGPQRFGRLEKGTLKLGVHA